MAIERGSEGRRWWCWEKCQADPEARVPGASVGVEVWWVKVEEGRYKMN